MGKTVEIDKDKLVELEGSKLDRALKELGLGARFSAGLVELEGSRLGREIKEPGAGFWLSEILDSAGKYNRSVEVYFRTEDKDIYCLAPEDLVVLFVSSNGYPLRCRVLPTDAAERLKKECLTVGEKFGFAYWPARGEGPATINSPAITEMVCATTTTFTPDYLYNVTKGATNNIVHDFNKKVPSNWREMLRKEEEDRRSEESYRRWLFND
jgi:hypothetical protein